MQFLLTLHILIETCILLGSKVEDIDHLVTYKHSPIAAICFIPFKHGVESLEVETTDTNACDFTYGIRSESQ